MDSALQSLFIGRKGFVLISSGEHAPAPIIDGITIGKPDTYPQGWEAISATSTETRISLKISEGETDWAIWDDLDTICARLQYITLGLSQVSMTKEVFGRTFGAGTWDSQLGAYRAEGRVEPVYKSLLVCFFTPKKVMGVYFSRVKLKPGDSLLEVPKDYFVSVPIAGYVQEPVATAGGKYAIYKPRERR